MLKTLFGLFLIAHGLIHVSLTTVPGPQASGPNTPFWPGWWRSDSHPGWLVTSLHLDNALVRGFGSLLIVLATIGFVAAGLGVLGVPFLQGWWGYLALVSAALALPVFVLFWHPWLVLGVLLNMALAALLLLPNAFVQGLDAS